MQNTGQLEAESPISLTDYLHPERFCCLVTVTFIIATTKSDQWTRNMVADHQLMAHPPAAGTTVLSELPTSYHASPT